MYLKLPSILLVAAMIFFVSCEGPEGPAGADGNTSCLTCHSTDGMTQIEASYALSGHNAAQSVGYAGGRGSCARCHSHSGFINFLSGLDGADPIDIDFPTKINCETCHGNHGSLEEGIEAPIRTIEPVIALADEASIDFDGNSNLCANCHQSRRDASYYLAIDSVEIDDVLTAVGAGNVGINSSHAGPHHGPQANVLLGMGGYGNSESHAHASASCTGCHMGEASATEGGHSFKPNNANCNECHDTPADFDYKGAISSYNTRIAAIANALVTAGALSLDAETGEYHPHVSIVPEATFEAFWNYMMCYEDHSHGVHNPAYIKTLLTQAEAKLGL